VHLVSVAIDIVIIIAFVGDGLPDLACEADVLILGEAAPLFRDNAAPCNGMMPPPDSEMIAPPITE
jgi:hypothetical protein